MAKVKSPRPAPPGCLVLDLFSPGMTALHRAGLGGLASTLRYIERAYDEGALTDEALPGWPWGADGPPWRITPRTVELRLGPPGDHQEFLERLFKVAFDRRD